MVAVGLGLMPPFTSCFFFLINLMCIVGSPVMPLSAVMTSVFDFMMAAEGAAQGHCGRTEGASLTGCWTPGEKSVNTTKECENNRSSTQGHSRDTTTSKSGGFQVTLHIRLEAGGKEKNHCVDYNTEEIGRVAAAREKQEGTWLN